MKKNDFEIESVLSKAEAYAESWEQCYSKFVASVYALNKINKKKLTAVQKSRFDKLKTLKMHPRMPHGANRFLCDAQSKSYRALRVSQLGTIRASSVVPPKTIDSKEIGVKFAKQIGLPVPKSEWGNSLEKIDFSASKIIKPMYSDGGKCIFAIERKNGSDVYYDHFSKNVFKSHKELLAYIRERQRRQHVMSDSWIEEEMVVGSSGKPTDTFDVKIYSFYGDVQLVLQVDRWNNEKREYSYFTPDFKPCDTEQYPFHEEAIPVFDKKLVELARNVSLQIPWPHVRIDFLVSDNDIKFGEFSHTPGDSSTFNDEWDSRLAVAYHEANARLYEDFLSGKKFDNYMSVVACREG